MAGFRSLALKHFVLLLATSQVLDAFSPGVVKPFSKTALNVVASETDKRTGKPTGNSFLPAETRERALKGNPIEKTKQKGDATAAWVDVYEYAAKIRAGETSWEEIDKADLDTRLKYVGMLHRNKRTPGQFMMRLRVPNGIINSDQLRFYAKSVEKYGYEQGVVDITTRQNIQLRGVKIEDAPDIIDGLHARNQTSFQSALDNVRNVVGNPLAGIDENEMVDTRYLAEAVNDLASFDPVTETRGNPEYGNLPRKFNIAISGTRDDYSHTHINDIGLQPCPHAETGEMGFNVVLGGYMSIKRVAESVHSGMWIPADRASVIALCKAILRRFRDEGHRKDRQKARLMWQIEEYGIDKYREAITKEALSIDKNARIEPEQPAPTEPYTRRELLGVHKQPQEGKVRVGVSVPAGRLHQDECLAIADIADKYSDGEIRLTVEQNIIFPNVDEDKLDDLLAEPALGSDTRLSVDAGFILGNLVSCTGAQFCGLALIETKQNAEAIAKKLEELVIVDRPIRIHWTGCPNSCGQAQAGDIGIMGAPARKENEDGKKIAVPGCNIFVGGTIGEDGSLAMTPSYKGIPLAEEDLVPKLVEILKSEFGAKDRKKSLRKKISKFFKRGKK